MSNPDILNDSNPDFQEVTTVKKNANRSPPAPHSRDIPYQAVSQTAQHFYKRQRPSIILIVYFKKYTYFAMDAVESIVPIQLSIKK